MKSTLANGFKAALLAACFGVGTLALGGCEEGRFEEAGEEIDNAGDNMQDQLDEAGDELN
ncbi:MAG TPA: hypothetical protein VF210_22070 [Pseudomonadales bacterium]